MSGRIEAKFAALKTERRTALIPYVTAGFPFADITPELMHGMVEAGADVLVAGSFVFNSPDPVATLAELRAQLMATVGAAEEEER